MSMIALGPDRITELAQPSKRPSLVFFHKPGCSPCAAVTTQVEEVSHRYSGRLRVYLVDVSVHGDAVREYSGGGTPLVVLFDTRGLEEWRWRGGSVTAERMSARIEDVLR